MLCDVMFDEKMDLLGSVLSKAKEHTPIEKLAQGVYLCNHHLFEYCIIDKHSTEEEDGFDTGTCASFEEVIAEHKHLFSKRHRFCIGLHAQGKNLIYKIIPLLEI